MEFGRSVNVGVPLVDRRTETILPSSRSASQPTRRALRIRLHASLIALDALCMLCGFAFAGLVYPVAGHQWTVMATVAIPVYLGAAISAHAYSVGVSVDIRRGVLLAVQSIVLTAAVILFVAFYFKSSEQFSRMIFGIGFATSLVALAVMRTVFLRRARAILGGNPYSIALITDNPRAYPAGAFSQILATSSFDPGLNSPQMYDRLAMALSNADRVVLDCAPEHRLLWSHALQGANVQAEIIAPELARMAPRGLGSFADLPTIVVARGPLGLLDRVVKRGFDLMFAGLALLFLAPLLLLVAIAIRLESAGPVFFRQDRIGRANRIFEVYKFRSMRPEQTDGAGHISTRRDDDRITRVGRFIRMTSIDELPQLFNVLRGDMSVVGPRPHALGSRAEGQLFWEIDGRYWHRHAAKPGLTGLAQVRGYRGATNLRTDLTNRLQSDLEYLNGWTIWRDIKIILMTFSVIIHKNAY